MMHETMPAGKGLCHHTLKVDVMETFG